MAKLYFRYGAMNSGKSTAILQVAFNYEERGMRVLLVKPAIDTKGADTVVSRLGSKRKVDILASSNRNLFEIITTLTGRDPLIKCVLVDEAQFLQRQHINELFHVATQLGIPVICYGLRTDFKTQVFPGAARLLEIAHSLEELKTICRCGKKAILNGRKVNGTFVSEGSQVVIDGSEEVAYESLCGNCYVNFVGTIT